MTDDIDVRVDALKFEIEKSLRYHQRRRSFYETSHRFISLGVILTGSAAFGKVLGEPEWFGLAAAVLGALELVFGFSQRAKDHQLLHRRFTDLAADLLKLGEPTAQAVAALEARRLDIEADEPPVYWALEADCYNEVTIAWGRESHGLARMTLFRSLLKNWWRFESARSIQETGSR
jgi:hypothetical protein